jgi:hypothetical protein
MQTYSDNTAPANILCTYRVLAYNAAGESAWSNEASGTAQPATVPPPAPPFLNCDIAESLPPSSDPDLVLALGLNEGTGTTTADASGNGNTGTLNGATWTTQGKYGNALRFDGVNDRVEVGTFGVSGSALTVMAWIRSENLANCPENNDCRILSRANGITEQDHDVMLSTMLSGGVTRLRFRLKTAGNTATLIASSGTLVANTWFHAAAVYDGAQMRLYLDGVLVGSRAQTGSLTVSSGKQTWIGANAPGAEMPWRGQIDEVQVYGRALSPSDIQTAMATPIS